MTATHDPVTLATKVTISDDVLAQEVGDEVVLLDLASERYFGLDPVGTRIWELLPERQDLADILTSLCEEFDAEPARIEHDLLTLVQTLSEAGLVKVQ